MKRDWVTLAFGIALVGAVVGLSLRQHMTPAPAGSQGATESAALAAPAPAGPPVSAPAPDPGAGRPAGPPVERPRPRSTAPAPAAAAPVAAAPSPVAPVSPPPSRVGAMIPVVHRHAMGSCQGMLAATARGLSYDTANKTDAFTVAFAEVDEFEVDYLKKNLRVRRKAGRTWNFTNDSADALFVFHRDVSKAREKPGGALTRP